MDDYKIIVEQEHQTVMAHYEVEAKPTEGYQSEAALEKSLIKQESQKNLNKFVFSFAYLYLCR